MQIEATTHPGHETTYNWVITSSDGQEFKINAMFQDHVTVQSIGDPRCFPDLKTALNFVLGAPD